MTRAFWIIGFIAAFIAVILIFGCKSPTSPSECEGIQHCRDGMGTKDTTGGVE